MSENLKSANDTHIERKIFHFSGLVVMLLCTIFLPRWACWSIFLIVCVPMIVVDVARLSIPQLNGLFLKVVGPLLRKYEASKISGASYALLGVALVYGIYPLPVAHLAILFLAIGDPVASYFGLSYGKKKLWRNKSWAGFLACTLACSLSALLYLATVPQEFMDTNNLILTGLALGLIGGLSESIPLWKVDDNLSLPLTSGLLISIFASLNGGLLS